MTSFAAGSSVTGVKVGAAGDIACDPESPSFRDGADRGLECGQQTTSDVLVRASYDVVLVLGDIQYEDGASRSSASPTIASWGRVKAITRPVPGNHEYRDDRCGRLLSGTSATAAGDPAKGYYSFERRWLARDRAQLQLLPRSVAAARGSAQERGSGPTCREPMPRVHARVLAPSALLLGPARQRPDATARSGRRSTTPGADLVLVGHDHDYERFAPQDADGAATSRADPRVRRRHGRPQLCGRSRASSRTARCATRRASACSSSRSARTPTRGTSGRPSARSPTQARPAATDSPPATRRAGSRAGPSSSS